MQVEPPGAWKPRAKRVEKQTQGFRTSLVRLISEKSCFFIVTRHCFILGKKKSQFGLGKYCGLYSPVVF